MIPLVGIGESGEMSRMNEKEQEKLKKKLNELLRQPDNKYCSECGQRQPQWASTNLGVFFCLRCAGMHRNLGVHISTVRSTTLDSWKPEWVAVMESLGMFLLFPFYLL